MTLILMKEYIFDENFSYVSMADGGGGVSSKQQSGYTTGVNIEKIDDFINTLSQETTNIDKSIKEIFTLIRVDLYNYWTGDAYEEFKTSCETYEKPLQSIVTFLEAYRELLEETRANAQKLVEDVAKSID